MASDLPPQPVEYASPGTPRKSRVWLLAAVLAAVFVIGFVIMGYVGSRQVDTATGNVSVNSPSSVVLAPDFKITLKQRTRGRLPGGAGAPVVSIDDITRGQTLVKVTDANDALLLSQSMKEGETASFGYAGQTLHLTVIKLNNQLVGEDDATLRISATRQLTESDKIEILINHIASLEGAKFIRNGEEHDPRQAADHLRLKLRNAGDRVKTANDFIDGLATKSSMSGDLYKIRLKDGTEVPAGEYLDEQLKQIEQRK